MRQPDCLGVGDFYYELSDDLQYAVAPVGSLKEEQGIEAYVAPVAAPWLRVSTNLPSINPATVCIPRCGWPA